MAMDESDTEMANTTNSMTPVEYLGQVRSEKPSFLPELSADGSEDEQDVDFDYSLHGPDFTPSVSSSPSPEIESDPVSPRKPWLPSGVCFDDRMKLHANPDFSEKPAHPEDPKRIERIIGAFKEAGLVYTGAAHDSEIAKVLESNPTAFMYRIHAREATKAEICSVHTGSHFQWVQDLAKKTSEELRQMTKDMDQGRKSLYVGNLTLTAALISAGGAIETCKNVMEGHVKNAIAVIRPPGHHAESTESMGFCIFNNVSIAARVCTQDYPDTCRKVLILDWDVHHGNGIQNIFYNDPNVLYISIHIYQDGQFYPSQPDLEGVPDGGLDKCGRDAGEGRNVNIGWANNGMGDGEYMAAFQRIVMPIAQEFNPDLVIVAAGFDAAAGDELGGCFVTPECYAHMTHMLMSLADGKLAICLEGGYDLRAISRSALAVAKTLMGEPPPRINLQPLNAEANNVLNEVEEYQAPYWECMRSGSRASQTMKQTIEELHDLKTVRLGDVVRGYQKKKLSDQYNMISLYVMRDKISEVFKDQILITPDFGRSKKIFFILHDPPKLLTVTDPVEQMVTMRNSWITDDVLPYIDWAVTSGFGVIDVTIPMTSNTDREPESIPVKANEAQLQFNLNEIVTYLWDNYLDISEAQDIVIMGVGYSYIGIGNLLTSRNARHRISAILNFVTGSLHPVQSETDPALSMWYKEHSRVYVASDHLCWADEKMARRVRKNRFGRVVQSSEKGLDRMLATHFEESQDWVAGRLMQERREPEADANIVNGDRMFGGLLPLPTRPS